VRQVSTINERICAWSSRSITKCFHRISETSSRDKKNFHDIYQFPPLLFWVSLYKNKRDSKDFPSNKCHATSGRKDAGIINKLQYIRPGTNSGVRMVMAYRTSDRDVIEICTTDDEIEEHENTRRSIGATTTVSSSVLPLLRRRGWFTLKRKKEEDVLGGSSSSIVRAHIQQFGGGSSRPRVGGSWDPTNCIAETQTTTETHDAETQTDPMEFPFRW